MRDFRTHDVYPANVNEAILHGLEAGQQYQLRVMAFNNIGESNYTSGQPVIITTPGNILIRANHKCYTRGLLSSNFAYEIGIK